jgi:hypothetical protein
MATTGSLPDPPERQWKLPGERFRRTAASSAPDVAGLAEPNGGFVIASQLAVSASDNDIQVHIRTATGAAVTNFIVDSTTANDQVPWCWASPTVASQSRRCVRSAPNAGLACGLQR